MENHVQELERRTFPGGELRVDGGNGKPTIQGYAARFDSLSDDLGGFRERVVRGAFARSIAEDDIRVLWNHDSRIVLGRNRAGTLRLAEDQRGLLVTVKPPDWADEHLETIRRGDVSGMSFGFRVVRDHWERDADGEVRVLEEVQLFEVSFATFPAYADTAVALRSRAGGRAYGWQEAALARARSLHLRLRALRLGQSLGRLAGLEAAHRAQEVPPRTYGDRKARLDAVRRRAGV